MFNNPDPKKPKRPKILKKPFYIQCPFPENRMPNIHHENQKDLSV